MNKPKEPEMILFRTNEYTRKRIQPRNKEQVSGWSTIKYLILSQLQNKFPIRRSSRLRGGTRRKKNKRLHY